jgi:hypothetical protein
MNIMLYWKKVGARLYVLKWEPRQATVMLGCEKAALHADSDRAQWVC